MTSAWFLRSTNVALIFFLVSCGSNLAPVAESRWQSSYRKAAVHIVQRGDTLYSIAFRYDTDFRSLARLNHIDAPYRLRIGQRIYFSRHLKPSVSSPVRSSRNQRSWVNTRKLPMVYSPRNRYAHSGRGWLWPVSGKVVTNFIPAQGKKGINIACRKGENVRASAAGTVAYAGNGLAGYGNLIIIKHNNEFLTAYGNNAKINVSEGQRVKAGQVIGEAGVVDHRYIGVHFEIRKAGTPVNPLNYLQKG